jgi:hypothetical protein
MRRTASVLGVAAIAAALLALPPVWAADSCWYDDIGKLRCTDSGSTPGSSDEPPSPQPRSGPRYVYVAVDPVIGDCHYWSTIPGGFDTWDPFYDSDVLAAIILPRCPVVPNTPVDIPATAWAIFRSWTLDPPAPSLQPLDHGITGLPSFLASPEPDEITHSEILPDGRPLNVRARVAELRVDWGDETFSTYESSDADPYPVGSVTHTYRTKTCTPEYRAEHPSGGLCHPALEYYTIGAVYRWLGEYNTGSGWVQLGTLDRAASVSYDVDEVRGVPVAVP